MADRPFFPGVHALRAFAALLVVFEHAGYAADDYSTVLSTVPVYYGRVGVILFFAISGFVIALQRTKPVGLFVQHRLLRIYPSYWIALALAAVLAALSELNAATGWWAVALIPTSWPDTALSIPYWTLVFEVVFYALAAIAFALRASDRALTIAAILWICSVQVFGTDPADSTAFSFPGATGLLLSSAVQVFPLGLLCGIHYERLKRLGRWPLAVLAIVAFIASYAFPQLSRLNVMLEGLAACGLLLAVAEASFRFRLVGRLGDASYGIYLMHFPVMLALVAYLPDLSVIPVFAAGVVGGTLFGLFDHWLYRRMTARPPRIRSPR